MESFFGILKDECVGEIIYSSHDEVRLVLFTYMRPHLKSLETLRKRVKLMINCSQGSQRGFASIGQSSHPRHIETLIRTLIP